MTFDAKVVYLPVRHHSPACAFHVDRVIRELRPERVLIEGPRDASRLVGHLADPALRAPVSLYTTFVQRNGRAPPTRHAAHYPLADFSPELAGLRAAAAVGAEARFIDLTWPEQVLARSAPRRPGARNLLDERHVAQGAFLHAVARKAGARDVDDLWDALYESSFRAMDSHSFFAGVLAWCAFARHDSTADQLAAEGHLVREAAMAAAIRAGSGSAVVITGGFHTVALPHTEPAEPPAVLLERPEDAAVHLVRYHFEALDQLNGYGAGMPSPAFYQHLWEGRDVEELVVGIARRLRKRHGAPSTADVVAAIDHVRRLAAFRDHAEPTREDLLDGVRSVFVKGSLGMEGVAVLAEARKTLAGERVGSVPAGVQLHPLVLDFEAAVTDHRLALHVNGRREVVLDLYRSAAHRETSRFFHRLAVLEIPFAARVRGPDFVQRQSLDRVQEAWRYEWAPATEAALVERSIYGSTLREAAASRLLERWEGADRGSRRSEGAAALVAEACRCGLHDHAATFLERTSEMISADPSFASVAAACDELLLLSSAREPLEAWRLGALDAVATAAWRRAAELIPSLALRPEGEEQETAGALANWHAAADVLVEPVGTSLRNERLEALVQSAGAGRMVVGVATGLLFAEGRVEPGTLARRLAGELAAGRDGIRFLQGLMQTARSTCWQVPAVVEAIHGLLGALDETTFAGLLPELRLAFAELTPAECDKVALQASRLAGASIQLTGDPRIHEADLLRGVRIESRVAARLAREAGHEA